MKIFLLTTLFWCIAFPLLAALNTEDATVDPQALRAQVKQFAEKSDFDDIEHLVAAQDRAWKTAPSESYFQNMLAICLALGDGAMGERRYWLFRKVAWDALLKAEKAARLSLDMRIVDDSGDDILREAWNIGSYVDQASPDMFAAIRHDTAMMVMEHEREIHALLIPGYRGKPVAPLNDPVGTQLTRQNAIDNNLQEEIGADSGRLANIQFAYYLLAAYKRPPAADQELLEVLNAVNLKDPLRMTVLREVKRAEQSAAGASATPR